MQKDLRCEPIVIQNMHFPSQRAALAHFGVKERTFRSRIDGGWDYERAMTTPARNRGR